MSGLWAEIALILVFITANGFFAAAEISLVSARKAPMAALAAKGDRRAQLVVRLQNDPETFLATVQVGISLMTILAGVTGGAVFVQALQGAAPFSCRRFRAYWPTWPYPGCGAQRPASPLCW